MAESISPSKMQSNEEIIEELTKDLESQCASSDACDDKQPIETKEESKGAGPKGQPLPTPDDHVDESALREHEGSLTPEDLEERRSRASALKSRGNDEFKTALYLESLQTYTEALHTCPLDQKEDRSILYSNRAAAKIQLDDKESAIEDCTKAVDLNPTYVRAYLRRAKLYEELEKLDESLEDYKKVAELEPGNAEARTATIRLPPLIRERDEKLKTEMFGKLKELGNTILKPFGLSTENFKMQQDPNTGGYSINFQQKSDI